MDRRTRKKTVRKRSHGTELAAENIQLKEKLSEAINLLEEVYDYVESDNLPNLCSEGKDTIKEIAEILGKKVELESCRLYVDMDNITLPAGTAQDDCDSYHITVKDLNGNVLYEGTPNDVDVD